MADYKRMVSYMYQYDKGVKKKNVGYARIEARNGECKFTLHMQLLGLLDSIFPTYLIQRKGEDMELIYLGDSVLKNQVLDSKMTASENNIMNSGFGLSDMGGMLLFLNDEIFYATQWDDKPIVLNEIMEALRPKNKASSKPRAKEEPKGNEPEGEPQNGGPPKPSDREMTKEDQKSPGTDMEVAEHRKVELPELGSKADEAPAQETKENHKNQFKKDPLDFSDVMDDRTIPVYKLPRGWKTIEMLKSKEKNTGADPWGTIERIRKANQHESRDTLPTEEHKKAIEFTKELDKKQRTEELAVDPVKIDKNHEDKRLELAAEPEEKPVEIVKEYEDRRVELAAELEENPEEIAKEYEAKRPELAVELEENPVELAEEYEDKRSELAAELEDIPVEIAREHVEDTMESASKKIKQPEPYPGKNPVHSTADGMEAADYIQKPGSNYNREETENPLAAKIFESYPRIYPFEDNEVTMCVKIEPKDIGYLPVDAWVLSNNSFLMHGYYCYNHLIFAKLKDRFGIRYILGVPGIYHNRERFMARMFGFDCFKPIRRRELRQGDFGYWYIPISM